MASDCLFDVQTAPSQRFSELSPLPLASSPSSLLLFYRYLFVSRRSMGAVSCSLRLDQFGPNRNAIQYVMAFSHIDAVTPVRSQHSTRLTRSTHRARDETQHVSNSDRRSVPVCVCCFFLLCSGVGVACSECDWSWAKELHSTPKSKRMVCEQAQLQRWPPKQAVLSNLAHDRCSAAISVRVQWTTSAARTTVASSLRRWSAAIVSVSRSCIDCTLR